MRQFLILFDDLPIDRMSVKAGENSPQVVMACRCINVGLFLSGDMRRDVTVTIATGSQRNMTAITFPGDSLKRVSPDERSISFFLLKALTTAKALPMNARQVLDNGIAVAKGNLDMLISAYDSQSIFLAQRNGTGNIDMSDRVKDALLIYNTGMLIDSIENLQPTLPHPPRPERFILDINEWLDNRRNEY
jgi:tRNA pseudouridine-54 N-methylase